MSRWNLHLYLLLLIMVYGYQYVFLLAFSCPPTSHESQENFEEVTIMMLTVILAATYIHLLQIQRRHFCSCASFTED